MLITESLKQQALRQEPKVTLLVEGASPLVAEAVAPSVAAEAVEASVNLKNILKFIIKTTFTINKFGKSYFYLTFNNSNSKFTKFAKLLRL